MSQCEFTKNPRSCDNACFLTVIDGCLPWALEHATTFVGQESTGKTMPWGSQLTPPQYTGTVFAAIVIVVFTWQGLSLVSKPEEWLIRHGRATGEKHIRASRVIGWGFLAAVGLILSQLIRSLYAK